MGGRIEERYYAHKTRININLIPSPKAKEVYRQPPPKGAVFNGTLPDGTTCINITACKGKSTTVDLEHLYKDKGTQLWGRFACIVTHLKFKKGDYIFDVGTPLFGLVNAYFHASDLFSDFMKDAVHEAGVAGFEAIDIMSDETLGCNAAYFGLLNTILLGVCKKPGRRIKLENDGTVVRHEGGHRLLSYINPDIGGHFSSIEGGALHEAFSDMMAVLYTGRTTVGEDMAGFIPGKEQQGYLRNVDNKMVLTAQTSTRPHERGLVYSGYFWDMVKYLMAKGVSPANARRAVKMILIEHAYLYSPKEIEPEDVVKNFFKAAMDLFEEGRLNDLLPKNFNKNAFYMEIVQNGIRRGLVRGQAPTSYYTSLLQDAFLPLGEPEETEEVKFDKPPYAYEMPYGRFLRRHRQLQLVTDGPLKGNLLIVEGYGWSKVEVGGRKKVISRHVKKKDVDFSVNYSSKEAAKLVTPLALFNALKSAGYPAEIIKGVAPELLKGLKGMWAAKFELVVPRNGNSIHYKFFIGPLAVYVSAKDGSLFIGKTIFH